MLVVKAIHLISMVAWFAGLFYLPRLFVYHSQCQEDEAGSQRFKVMERKLFFIIMTPAAIMTILTGVWMLYDYAWVAFKQSGWLHTKLSLVLLLVIFHIACWR